jgi:MGT family glycosyltransferase
MRALFTCYPLFGHFLPLTPIARAMVEGGHDVAFGTPVFFRPAVEAAGFRWVRAGVEQDDPEMTPVPARILELRGDERRRYFITHVFGDVHPRRLAPELLALAEAWRPELFVCDSREFGALLAGDLLGIPYATVEVHAVPNATAEVHAGDARPSATSLLHEPLQRLRASYGLPECDIQGWIDRYLVLTFFPPSLATAGDPIGPTTHYVRALPPDVTEGSLPSWLVELGTRPLVYVSLGTALSRERASAIFSKLLAGLHGIEAEVVVTVGRDLDPAALGPQPEHIHLERFLPLGALLPRCSLVLFHGGSGTLGYAIANGLPMVILPLGADQPENAARCAELGASRTLDQDNLTPEHVRDVVRDVLHAPSYRLAAERLRDEFNALPGSEYAARLLERLARDKAPIMASR